jgi:hypothetical protein
MPSSDAAHLAFTTCELQDFAEPADFARNNPLKRFFTKAFAVFRERPAPPRNPVAVQES